ncbi:phenylacetate--CoA ligase family protein [bacterium]|nr:phenylacetate--CoA ligase family protein [bacterium]
MIFRKWLFHINEKGMKGCTWHVYDELLKNESLSKEQMKALQWEKIQKLIQHAYHTVPYYRDTWKKRGIQPRDIRSYEDFHNKIPVISKTDVRKNLDRFFSETPLPGLMRVDTSGTTGSPGTFYHDGQSRSYGLACRYRGRQWWGVSPIDNEIRLWGRSSSFSPSVKVRTKDKMKRFKDWLIGVKYLSTFNMKEENLEQWLRVVHRNRPKVILGYSSAIYTFSRYLQRKEIDLTDSGIKVITYTSEPFYDHQKEVARQTFCHHIASEYGSVENGNIGFECPEGSLHTMDDGVYLESVDIQDEKEQFIVTNLENFSFPLIRYNTQDVGTISNQPCSCGRPLRVIKLNQGRMFDNVYTSSGEIINTVALDHVIIRPLFDEKYCRRYQAIQEKKGEINVLIETNSQLPEEIKSRIERNIWHLSGEKMIVNIYEKEHLDVEKSGKFKFIISRVNT